MAHSFCSCSLKFSLSKGLTVKCIAFPCTLSVLNSPGDCGVAVLDLRSVDCTGQVLVDMISMILCSELTNTLVICSIDGITDNIPVNK